MNHASSSRIGEPAHFPLSLLHAVGIDAGHSLLGKKGRMVLVGCVVAASMLLGAGAFAVMLFYRYDNGTTELDRHLKHFNEVTGELVKKESLKVFNEHIAECIKEQQANTVAIDHLRRELEAAHKAQSDLEREVAEARQRLAQAERAQGLTPAE